MRAKHSWDCHAFLHTLTSLRPGAVPDFSLAGKGRSHHTTCGSWQALRGNMTTETSLNLTRHDRRKPMTFISSFYNCTFTDSGLWIQSQVSPSLTLWSRLTAFSLLVDYCFLSHNIVNEHYTLTLITFTIPFRSAREVHEMGHKGESFARSLVRRQCRATATLNVWDQRGVGGEGDRQTYTRHYGGWDQDMH